ncbi:MAG: WD40/YVTN/BNR-like repeat-containing protein, partial [Bryobacteraceae bacterium]
FVPSSVFLACAMAGAPQIWKSESAGTACQGCYSAASGGISGSDPMFAVPPLVADPSTQNRFYFGTSRLWQYSVPSNGAMGSWAAISGDLRSADPLQRKSGLTAIAVAPNNPSVIYTGADDGTLQMSRNVSQGAIATFRNISAGLPARLISKIAVDSGDATGNTAYAAISGFSLGAGSAALLGQPPDLTGHLFMTKDGGTSWSDVSCHTADCSQPGPADLPNTPVNDIVVDPDDPAHNTLFVATDMGVFATSDGGATWSVLGAGLPKVVVLSLALHEPSRTLRAATHGRSVWDLALPALANTANFALAGIFPISLSSGDTNPSITLTIRGTTANPAVLWNGSTNGISIQQVNTSAVPETIVAGVSPSLLTQTGIARISVFDASQQPTATNALPLSVASNAPVLTAVQPSSVTAGSADLSISVTGTGIAPNAILMWDGASTGMTTTAVNSAGTQINGTISHTLLQYGGTFPVGVANPQPSGGTASASLPFVVNGVAPPANDAFASAILIQNGNYTVSEDNSGATTELSDPVPPCLSGENPASANGGRGKTIWWQFTPGSTQTLTANTLGSSYDTVLSAWTGAANNLAPVSSGCDDDVAGKSQPQSQISFTAVAGTTYFFMVSVWDSTLCVNGSALNPLECGGQTTFHLSFSAVGGSPLTTSPPTATISAGNSTAFTISTASPPLTGTVAFTVAGCPAASVCAFSPASVTAGSATQLTVTTTARGALPVATPNADGNSRPRVFPTSLFFALLAGTLAFFFFAMRNCLARHGKWAAALPAAALCMAVVFIAAGCNLGLGGSSDPPPVAIGTPAGAYPLTITGTAGTTTATSTVTLNVN